VAGVVGPRGDVEVGAPVTGAGARILTPPALDFVAGLHREFESTRRACLARRVERQAAFDAGALPDFLPETRAIREAEWTVASTPPDLQRRWVEITGPAERKMVINALNSGADVFMADFEDAHTPTWTNMVEGQANLADAIDRTIELVNPDGRVYRLRDEIATLLVRPRGWHLVERHLSVDGAPVSGSLFDVGLYLFHNGRRLLDRGTGAPISTCRSSRVTGRCSWGTTSSSGARRPSACPAGRSRPPSWWSRSWPPSTWTRSSTSSPSARQG